MPASCPSVTPLLRPPASGIRGYYGDNLQRSLMLDHTMVCQDSDLTRSEQCFLTAPLLPIIVMADRNMQ
jgi:hypothetical protein